MPAGLKERLIEGVLPRFNLTTYGRLNVARQRLAVLSAEVGFLQTAISRRDQQIDSLTGERDQAVSQMKEISAKLSEVEAKYAEVEEQLQQSLAELSEQKRLAEQLQQVLEERDRLIEQVVLHRDEKLREMQKTIWELQKG